MTVPRKSQKTPTDKKRTAAKKPVADKASPYTDTALRERLKKEITAGDKGGKPGQWSARKAQLLKHEYEAAGGGYTGKKTATQEHLSEWTEEKWTTADGKPAERGDETARYLPEKAWEELSPAEKKATDAKKRAGSKAGKQHEDNTPKAKAARKKATKG